MMRTFVLTTDPTYNLLAPDHNPSVGYYLAQTYIHLARLLYLPIYYIVCVYIVRIQWCYMEAVTYPFTVFSILSWSAATRTDRLPTWSCREWACGCLCRTRPCSGSFTRSRTKFWPKWTRHQPSLKCCRVSTYNYLYLHNVCRVVVVQILYGFATVLIKILCR